SVDELRLQSIQARHREGSEVHRGLDFVERLEALFGATFGSRSDVDAKRVVPPSIRLERDHHTFGGLAKICGCRQQNAAVRVIIWNGGKHKPRLDRGRNGESVP